MKEIERRFLVHHSRLPKLVRGQKIIQGYLSLEPVIRTRLKNNSSFLTIKFYKEGYREEFEFKIPIKEARKLLSGCKYKLEKTRYNLKLKNELWEIDIFEGENEGLVLAEIELKTKNQRFQKPLWLADEVTDNLKYLNVNLAQVPYSTWKN